MLSQKEYEDTLWKYNNIPTYLPTKTRHNLRQIFRKKLIEHKYASTYPPFQPLPYELIFINYRTSEETLIHLNDIIKCSTTFTLDTESAEVYKRPNKPALIQLQIITHETQSHILFFEVCHLPRTSQLTFKLIQQLFESLFQPEKKIYIWGTIDELKKFIHFNLFSSDQIYFSENINLQDDFKKYWKQHHPHISTSSTTNDSTCICEACIGIQANNPWSIQDATAYQLNKWLDKRLTRSPFDIGLDPKLIHLNSKELEYRQVISRYAAYDCDTMYQLIINMNLIDQQQPSSQFSDQMDITSPTINEDTNYELEQISPDDNELNEQPQSIEENKTNEQPQLIEENETNEQYGQLSAEERRKIHNRSCTEKQRKRYYRNKIIIKNIDKRFHIREMKDILRHKNISFYTVNISDSSTTLERTLYIAIRDASKLSSYKIRTQGLFTKSHYKEYQRQKQAITSYHRRSNYNRNYDR
jgi:hypothetical protein